MYVNFENSKMCVLPRKTVSILKIKKWNKNLSVLLVNIIKIKQTYI